MPIFCETIGLIVSQKSSAAKAESQLPKSFGFGRLCLASVIVWLWFFNKFFSTVQNCEHNFLLLQNRILWPIRIFSQFSSNIIFNICTNLVIFQNWLMICQRHSRTWSLLNQINEQNEKVLSSENSISNFSWSNLS